MSRLVAKDHLRAFVERIERMDEEIKALNDDKRDIYAEAKANGFDPKALKIVVRRRAQDADQLREQDAIVELYEDALGMGNATRARAREGDGGAGLRPIGQVVAKIAEASRQASGDGLELPEFLDRSKEHTPRERVLFGASAV